MAYILSKQDIESLFLTKNIPLRINAVPGLVTFMTSRDVIIPENLQFNTLLRQYCLLKILSNLTRSVYVFLAFSTELPHSHLYLVVFTLSV